MGPLFQAIQTGRDLRPLLRAGHSPNVYAEFPGVSWTPLHLAVYGCLHQVAQILLDALANPNSPGLASAEPGPYSGMQGLTSLDLALNLKDDSMVRLLVRAGARPTLPGRSCPTLQHEMARARAVEVATSLVVEPIFLPLVERAQQAGEWDEADRLLQRILAHEGEGDQTLHRRIRGLLARGKVDEAMEEASLIFVVYRRQGKYLAALQVARSMRQIDPTSSRPYDLEIEFVSGLGWLEAAEQCLEKLLELHHQQGRAQEIPASRARFEILRRRPENRQRSRPPQAWTAAGPGPVSNPSNLPALLEEEPESAPWWKLWWQR